MAFHMCVGWQANSLLLCVHQRQSLMSLTLPWANWGSHSWLFVFSHHDLSREVVDCLLPSINHFPLAATVHPELWNPFPLKKKKHESNCRCLSLSLHYLLLPNVTRPKALDDWWPNVKAFRTELEHKSTEISSSHSGHKTCILSYNGGFQSTLVHHWKTAASCLPQGRHFLYHSFVVLSCSMCPKEPRERGKQTQAMCLGQSNAGFLSLGFIDFFKTRH